MNDRQQQRLVVALRWALEYIADGADQESGETPEHTCDFIRNPESGRCEFHEQYFTAWETLVEAEEPDV